MKSIYFFKTDINNKQIVIILSLYHVYFKNFDLNIFLNILLKLLNLLKFDLEIRVIYKKKLKMFLLYIFNTLYKNYIFNK